MQQAALFKHLTQDNSGATIVEYGLLVSLIALAVMALMQDIGASTSDSLTSASTEFQKPG